MKEDWRKCEEDRALEWGFEKMNCACVYAVLPHMFVVVLGFVACN